MSDHRDEESWHDLPLPRILGLRQLHQHAVLVLLGFYRLGDAWRGEAGCGIVWGNSRCKGEPLRNVLPPLAEGWYAGGGCRMDTGEVAKELLLVEQDL